MMRNAVSKSAVGAWSLLALLVCPLASPVDADTGRGHILVQSTTSTENSGLFEAILPQFTAQTGIEVRVVAVGTGQAIKNARNCDGDVLFVHDRASEERFVADGAGLGRADVMYNDFVIVGPAVDPAGIAGSGDVAEALSAIAATGQAFVSRGDQSGTHKAERRLWAAAGVDPDPASGTWYRESGSGMGATLNIAAGMDAYTLSDRATWVAFANKAALAILVEGDDRLFNQYGVILVSSEACPTVRAEAGQAFVDWLIGPVGQAAIAGYRRDGRQLFFPNANRGTN